MHACSSPARAKAHMQSHCALDCFSGWMRMIWSVVCERVSIVFLRWNSNIRACAYIISEMDVCDLLLLTSIHWPHLSCLPLTRSWSGCHSALSQCIWLLFSAANFITGRIIECVQETFPLFVCLLHMLSVKISICVRIYTIPTFILVLSVSCIQYESTCILYPSTLTMTMSSIYVMNFGWGENQNESKQIVNSYTNGSGSKRKMGNVNNMRCSRC